MQTNCRHALSDCEVNGFQVRRRDNIVLVLGAANRGPDIFEDQDRLDIGRGEGVHLSFGRGIHHCLGALLARLEGRIVFEMLLKRLAKIDLLGEQTKFRTSVVFRGLHSLPLRCARA